MELALGLHDCGQLRYLPRDACLRIVVGIVFCLRVSSLNCSNRRRRHLTCVADCWPHDHTYHDTCIDEDACGSTRRIGRGTPEHVNELCRPAAPTDREGRGVQQVSKPDTGEIDGVAAATITTTATAQCQYGTGTSHQ